MICRVFNFDSSFLTTHTNTKSMNHWVWTYTRNKQTLFETTLFQPTRCQDAIQLSLISNISQFPNSFDFHIWQMKAIKPNVGSIVTHILQRSSPIKQARPTGPLTAQSNQIRKLPLNRPDPWRAIDSSIHQIK